MFPNHLKTILSLQAVQKWNRLNLAQEMQFAAPWSAYWKPL